MQHARKIRWLPWGREAFALAQAENKPVLLSISAVWCHWCRVMDETSYTDPDVGRMLSDSFVTVRADSDHRPDIDSRYNVGGWPTTAFLTAHGGLIGGATYLPPDQFLSMLAEFRLAYQEDRPQLYDQAGERLRQRRERVARSAAGEPPESWLVDRTARRVAGAYDAINGGFGLEPKFPNPPILQYAAHLYRTTGEAFYGEMLRKTLDAMLGGIFDPVDGGFFRNATAADWSDPQMEKMLEDNVLLARVYLEASDLLSPVAPAPAATYRDAAERTIDCLLSQLYDDAAPGFRGSRGAHSGYFALPPAERRAREGEMPPADPSCYASGNALAASLLLEAAWKLGRPALADTALAVLDALDAAAANGCLSHVMPAPAKAGDANGLMSGPSFLTDWANLLSALVDAHSHTRRPRYLERAGAVAVELLDRFFDHRNGGFFDIEADPDAVGHLRVREKPLPDNAAAAMGFLKLHQATGDGDFHQVAQTALSAFADVFQEYGEHAAPYGRAVDLLNNAPVEVTVEGRPSRPDTLAMLSAAARLSCPNLAIKPVPVENGGYPAQAHVCLDTLCLPPVSDPEALAPLVVEMLSGRTGPLAASPFDNIFDRLG